MATDVLIPRQTVALPDSRHPRIAVFSGSFRAKSHINGSRTHGSRTHGVADARGRGRAAAVLIITQSIARNTYRHEVTTTVDSQYGNNKRQGFDSSRRCKRTDGPLCSALPVQRFGTGHCLRAKRGAPRVLNSSLASAEVAFANVEQPHTLAPLIERAAHVIYLAGGNRRGLSPGAWQVEVDGLPDCLELAKRSGLPGRWISVSYSRSDQRTGATTWAETRWRELKLAADEVIAASGVNYFVLRRGRIAAPVSTEPLVSMTQNSVAAHAELPCNSLAFLLTGAALSGAANRSACDGSRRPARAHTAERRPGVPPIATGQPCPWHDENGCITLDVS